MNVYRIHIKPHRDDEIDQELFEFCLQHGILGVGWFVGNLQESITWQQFYDKAVQAYPKNADLTVFAKHMANIQQDDLIVTKDRHANYYLAKVISGWEYMGDSNINPKKFDIHNIVHVSFQKIPSAIKGGEMYEFFNGKYRQNTLVVIEESTQIYTKELYKYLWNKLSGTDDYHIDEHFLHMIKQIQVLH